MLTCFLGELLFTGVADLCCVWAVFLDLPNNDTRLNTAFERATTGPKSFRGNELKNKSFVIKDVNPLIYTLW